MKSPLLPSPPLPLPLLLIFKSLSFSFLSGNLANLASMSSTGSGGELFFWYFWSITLLNYFFNALATFTFILHSAGFIRESHRSFLISSSFYLVSLIFSVIFYVFLFYFSNFVKFQNIFLRKHSICKVLSWTYEWILPVTITFSYGLIIILPITSDTKYLAMAMYLLQEK